MKSSNIKSLDNQKEAMRKKSLGELGELFAIKTLIDHHFDKIRNINDDHMNEAFTDIICEKDNQKYVISVKARNMYQVNGKINNRYNLGSNVYGKAKVAEEKYSGIAYWMAIQFDFHHYSVFWGSLESLNGSKAIPINKCKSGEIGTKLVDNKRHYFDFEFYKNVKHTTNTSSINSKDIQLKQIYKITYPNNKIYIGKDLTGTLTYFGSVDSKYVEIDFTPEQLKCFPIKKEILWESENANDSEVNKKEVEMIKMYKSNNPEIGYNRWPKKIEEI